MKWNLKRNSRYAALALALTSVANTSHADTTIVVHWNEALLQAVRDTNSGPTITSRALAVAHTCMYEAWASYDDRARSSLGNMPSGRSPASERTDGNISAAISHAAYRAAVDLFPDETQAFTEALASAGQAPDLDNFDTNTPAGVANRSCQAVLEMRHDDGANQLGDKAPGAYSDYTGYEPVNSPDNLTVPDRWQPLRVTLSDGTTRVQQFLTPHWGGVTPFAMKPPKSYQLKRPAAFDSREFMEQVLEVVTYSAYLTDAQKMSAAYWADGPNTETPPGHWNLFAQYVSERDDHTVQDDVKLFFALNNAVMDAGIFAWWAKREYDYVRPITAVRTLLAGETIPAWSRYSGKTELILGEHWEPYQATSSITPPFAEYVSGHSTFSAAAAEVLKRFTQSDVFGYKAEFPAGSSYIDPGVTPVHDLSLSWATFTDAANDAGASRRFGGIHFLDADMEGRRIGQEIGEQVWNKAQRLFRDK